MIFASVGGLLAVESGRCVLLDGCFDPIHFGHVRYVREAKRAFPNWPIVVGVSSDDEIRSKGREPLLGQISRCATVDGLAGVDVVLAKDRPTHEIISVLKPAVYVKGKDWEGKLPAEQLAACSLNNVEIHYTDTVVDSSTDRLRRWALKDAEQSLDRLEAFMAAQEPSSPEKFDREYFEGQWRKDGNAYDYETRKAIEGKHPQLIKEAFPGLSVLDVGCGPGHLVRMLKELGVNAGGCDPSSHAVALAWERTVVNIDACNVPSNFADVAICREVLEHVPVIEIPEMVCDLFRVARKFTYITTRFHDGAVFDATTDFETDPTHVSLLTQPFLRSLCVLHGGKRRRDLEQKLDHQNKGRVLVYEVQ